MYCSTKKKLMPLFFLLVSVVAHENVHFWIICVIYMCIWIYIYIYMNIYLVAYCSYCPTWCDQSNLSQMDFWVCVYVCVIKCEFSYKTIAERNPFHWGLWQHTSDLQLVVCAGEPLSVSRGMCTLRSHWKQTKANVFFYPSLSVMSSIWWPKITLSPPSALQLAVTAHLHKCNFAFLSELS